YLLLPVGLGVTDEGQESHGSPLREDDVGRLARGHVLGAGVAELPGIEAGEQVLTRAQEGGRDGQVDLVDQARGQVLPDRGHAAAEPDVLAAGGPGRPRERPADSGGAE